MKKTSDLEQALSGKIKLNTFLEANADQFITYDMNELLTPLMKERKLSKAELARRAKMSDVYLFQILSGRRQPSRDKLLLNSLLDAEIEGVTHDRVTDRHLCSPWESLDE